LYTSRNVSARDRGGKEKGKKRKGGNKEIEKPIVHLLALNVLPVTHRGRKVRRKRGNKKKGKGRRK